MAGRIDAEDATGIRNVLRHLQERCDAEACLVCDSGGSVISEYGRRPPADPRALCALAAGVFGATRELARALGENEFSAVYHRGGRRSIFITAADPDVLLVVIFRNESGLGLVKLYARPAAVALGTVVRRARPRGGDEAFVLSDEMDIFSAGRG